VTGERQRQNATHNHPELWAKEDHYRFEDRMHSELKDLEIAVDKLTTRITLMLGGLTLIAVLLPVIAPFIRAWLNIQP